MDSKDLLQVQAEFKKIKKRQRVTSVLFLATFFAWWLWKNENRSYYLLIGAILIMIIFSLWSWRCPACRGSLGKWTMRFKYCPCCGIQLAP